MARTIKEIKETMTKKWMEDSAICEKYGFELDDQRTFEQYFSRASIESIWFYIVAFAHWTIETLFDKHTTEVDEKIRMQRNHTIAWYRTTAMNFQFSTAFNPQFLPDITEYDNTNFTEDDIEEMKIIRKCSVTVADMDKPTLIIKVHKADGPLTEEELEAFETYMSAKADAGVNLRIVSEAADKLVLSITVRRDPMVLDVEGLHLTSREDILRDTVEKHLENLIFNGAFYPTRLEQELMLQPGIRVATVTEARAGVNGSGEPAVFDDNLLQIGFPPSSLFQ